MVGSIIMLSGMFAIYISCPQCQNTVHVTPMFELVLLVMIKLSHRFALSVVRNTRLFSSDVFWTNQWNWILSKSPYITTKSIFHTLLKENITKSWQVVASSGIFSGACGWAGSWARKKKNQSEHIVSYPLTI